MARRPELSVRLALGASRWRLIRAAFTDSFVMSCLGTMLGVPIAVWTSRLLVSQLSTPGNTVFLDLSIDGRMLAFTVAVTGVTTLLFGTAPAFWTSQVSPMNALKELGRTTLGAPRRNLTNCLVVAQVSLSLVLLVAAGLFGRTFAALARRPLGLEPDHVLVAFVNAQRAAIDPSQRIDTYMRLRDAVRQLPNVGEAAVSLTTPVGGGEFTPFIELSGRPFSGNGERVFGNLISPGYFNTLGTPISAGRDLMDADRKGAPRVAVVNGAFVRALLDGATPIGRTIVMYPRSPFALPPMEIVGVVADAVYSSLRDPAPPTFYVPLAQFDLPRFPLTGIRLSVRSKGAPASMLAKSVVAAVGGVNPQLALTTRPLDDQIDAALTQERVVASLAAAFGALALLLTGLGLYGMASYAVSCQRTEIGIRMALGAAAGTVVRLVVSRVCVLVAVGVGIGALVSMWASRFIATLLYGIAPRDPLTLFGATAALVTVGALAAGFPAWRAAHMDPSIVLRGD